MEKYEPQKIEKKWQEKWEKEKLYQAKDFDKREKFYCLDMFPYPSSEGLHVGHWRGYVLSDLMARFQMLSEKNVLHPMGYDAFGLPAENAAIKNQTHPKIYTQKAIQNFRRQLKQIGAMFDWTREINTSEPEYYQWTQWLFLKLYENKLAYRQKAPVNFCPNCQTVLANEQVVAGECERCGGKVTKKELTQWFFKITAFTEELLKDLDDLDWPERTKTLQRNWIGKSEGAMVKFQIPNSKFQIKVFTTRPDTLYGATFLVLAPENPLIEDLKFQISNLAEVENYIDSAKNKSELERTENKTHKTGVKLEGLTAINPINKMQIPIWVADYVLSSYGTGACMCVPAHDERDFEFAKKFGLPIREVIIPERIDKRNPPITGKEKVERKNVQAIVKNPKTGKYLVLHSKKHHWNTFPMGGIENNEDIIEAAKREVIEESGYKNLKNGKILGGPVRAEYFANHKDQNRISFTYLVSFDLGGNDQNERSEEEKTENEILWIDDSKLNYDFMVHAEMDVWLDRLNNPEKAYEDNGVLINSGEFNNLLNKDAAKKITQKLNKIDAGDFAVSYKLRDWLISRQRYWGAPIPIIYCEKCGEVAVPEKDLPVKLPEDVEFRPHGDSPLRQSKEFFQTACPKCGGKAQRETDTMDTFVDSAWYYLAYTMLGTKKLNLKSKNEENIFTKNKEEINYWMPIDFYVGGVEHAILHLLYARFISKALHCLNLVNFSKSGEPFKKLFNIGMIYLGGAKMSKSKGNVVSPDELLEKYGADALRGYELFLGPAAQDSAWQISGIVGIFRFLEKIWETYNCPFAQENTKDPIIEKSIQNVTTEVEALRPNTALSHLMELLSYIKKQKKLSTEYAQKINLLLAPFFPHLAEEIWQRKNKKSIFLATWPEYDQNLVQKLKMTLAVQINGKTRDLLVIEKEVDEDTASAMAKKSQKIKSHLKNKKIKKIIYITGKIINFVIE